MWPGMKTEQTKVSHAQMNKRLNEFIQSFVRDCRDDEIAMNAFDEAAHVFISSLTPFERGMLLYEDAIAIELSELSADELSRYSKKYGPERLKNGCFFRLSSGGVSFISDEYNLKYKV